MPIIDKSKPWQVNRKSWHYKIYNFARETRPTKNFCNYFWTVVLKVGLMLLALVMTLVLLGLYISAWLTKPLDTAIGTGIALTIIGVCIYGAWRYEKKLKSGNTQPNIVKQWVHAKKEKYCPGVEYVE